MKTVVITGANSGIGQAICEAFGGKGGWKVVGLARQDVDLGKLDDVSAFAVKLKNKLQQVDVLIHVAGIWHDQDQALAGKKLEQFSGEQIIQTVNVGLTSFMVLAAQFLPIMPKDGTIICITGTFTDGAAGWLPYYTSKRALEDFLVGLAQDYPNGPKVYGVSPAGTATPAYIKFYPEFAATAQLPEVVARLCFDLTKGKIGYKSGDIIEIRSSETKLGYHS